MTEGFRRIRDVMLASALLTIFSSVNFARATESSMVFGAQKFLRTFYAQSSIGKPLGAATISNALATPKKIVVQNSEPLEPDTKRRARFLAAFGLAMISLLALTTGVALLRAFRQR